MAVIQEQDPLTNFVMAMKAEERILAITSNTVLADDMVTESCRSKM